MSTQHNSSRIYMDIASTTPLAGEVRKAMEPYWSAVFGNPNSKHAEGARARGVFNEARKDFAKELGVKPDELIFTSGSTESNTLALRGVLEALEEKVGSLAEMHVLVSAIEHPSAADVIPYAEEKGMQVDIVKITGEGVVDLKEIQARLHSKTVLISVMYVNSEIGTIQNISGIADVVRKKQKQDFFKLGHTGIDKPILHTDATQAPLWLPMHTRTLPADLITLDAHKMYGPKGIGLLIARASIPLKAQVFGAEVHTHRRPGTPAVPLAIGFREALAKAGKTRRERVEKTRKLQQYFWKELESTIKDVRLNGSLEKRIAGNISITVPGANHDFLAVALDERGIACATRSACLEEGGEGSHVIEALAGEEERNALRFTFDALNTGGIGITKGDIDSVVKTLVEIVKEQKYR